MDAMVPVVAADTPCKLVSRQMVDELGKDASSVVHAQVFPECTGKAEAAASKFKSFTAICRFSAAQNAAILSGAQKLTGHYYPNIKYKL